ncbi:MAG: T9SS type A sorting domain-containing protein [Chitinophagales bacterium]|nr:T9SS type A sorting domain-containing protein [Chitinophagales bacterium]
MKNLISYIFVLCGINFAIAQETIDVKFNEAVPIWVHTMVDTTFVPVSGQPYFTKYSSLYPHIAHRDGDFVYTMGVCTEKQSLRDYGFVLDKIDLKTGLKVWSHYNTPYNAGHKDFYHTIYVSEKGIELVGSTEDTDGRLFATYKVIDINTGDLVKFRKSENGGLNDNFYTRYFDGHVLHSDSVLLHGYEFVYVSGTIENPIYDYSLKTEVYDRDMNILEGRSFSFEFDNLGDFSIDQPNMTLRLNENTLVSLAYKDRIESWDNLGTKIMWTNISDPYDIKIRQIRDYTDIVPGTKAHFNLQRFQTFNNSIFLSHYYPNFDIEQNTSYVLWLDSIGDIKTFVPVSNHREHIYELTEMMYANDDFAYLSAFPSVTGKYGFDIIRIEQGVDTVRYISSLTSAVEGEAYAKNSYNLTQLFDDGYLITGGYSTKEGQGTKSAYKIYCFKAADLGIHFEPVSTSNVSTSKLNFDIFPNPASSSLYVKLTDTNQNYKMNILDLNGKLISTSNIEQNFAHVDISNLHNGIYFVKLINEKGEQVSELRKLVKIE